MDVTFGAEHASFRSEARSWLAAHVPAEPLPPLGTTAGFEAHQAWEATMFADRWSAVSWPTDYGGRGLGIMEWLVFEEEYQRARGPERVNRNGIFVLAPTLLEIGTVAQKERFLPAIAAGEEVWCRAWSGAGGGRDLARHGADAVRSPAGDGWRLRGQKVWVDAGSFAQWCFGVFRTDHGAPRDHGLTCFLVSLDSPGVSRRTLGTMDGRPGLAEISFDDVEVPENQVLGTPGSGWSVALSMAGSEHGLSLRSPARYAGAAVRLLELFDQRGAPAAAADAVARAYVDAQAYELHTYWTASKAARGQAAGAEASCNRISSSETGVAIHETALLLLGPDAELLDAGSPDEWLDGFLTAEADHIDNGRHEIQREVVAARLLGLEEG